MFASNKICWAMPFTNTAVVIPEDYIHYPVQGILNAPMAPNRCRKYFCICREGTNEITSVIRCFIAYYTLRLHASNGF
jgi:hypothetical protein